MIRIAQIKEAPLYYAGEDGRIISTHGKGCVLRSSHFNDWGHLGVGLYVKGEDGVSVRLARPVHRLVMEAFIGPRPEGMECRHLDGDPANNRLSNLTWGTPKENAEDQRRHGSMKLGEASHYSRLTEAEVRKIRRNGAELSRSQLAAVFQVSQSQIDRILNRQNWKHI